MKTRARVILPRRDDGAEAGRRRRRKRDMVERPHPIDDPGGPGAEFHPASAQDAHR
jgi:hypothetical protein